jgi:hypothetical protein
MARRKKPKNESDTEIHTRKVLEVISNFSNRSEKTSWNRKMDNMVKLLATLRPLEDQILDLHAKKMPIFDDVQQLRATMVKECIHPYQHLIITDDHVLCKFCNRRISIPVIET